MTVIGQVSIPTLGYYSNEGVCPDPSSPCKGSSSETNHVLCFCTTYTRQFLSEI